MDRTGRPQAEAERSKKLRGLARYTADERFEGAAFAAFVRSPHAHARIVSLDTAEAAAMPGVVRVLTGQDCVGLGNFPVIDRVGKGLAIPFRPVLASDVVRHPGEAVACVVAETPAQAQDAAEAVAVDLLGEQPKPIVISDSFPGYERIKLKSRQIC